MSPSFAELWDRYFSPREFEGSDKRMPLAQAIERHVRPGMTIHLDVHAQAAMNELVRRFHGKAPGFTIALSIAELNVFHLVAAGLVKKAITSNLSYVDPAPAPSRTVGRMTRDGTLEVESWSLYALLQRFMAGALGLEFMPTRSIGRTDMARDNVDSFATVASPFSGESWGLVKALRPDISIIHGLAADPAGNTIPAFSEAEGVWGARASRGGVIVTTEKVVSTQFIRDNAAFVKIPGYMVAAVCETPLGAHPRSLCNRWVPGIEGYVDDIPFALDQRRATDNPDTAEGWLQEWVLGCPDQQAYLEKLGRERVSRLREQASGEAWRRKVEAVFQQGGQDDAEHSVTEMMVVAAGRRIRDIVRRNDYRLLLAGIGAGGLATCLAYYLLRDQGYDAEVVLGPGPFGHLPRFATLDSWHHLDTAKMTSDALDSYGIFLRGPDSKAMGVLGAAMVDKRGNINSNRLPNGAFLIGTGGADDVAAGAREALVVVVQSPQRLVERVSYVSVAGDNVRTLVTNLGIMEKDGDGEFVLTTCYPSEGSAEERVRVIRGNTGWELRVAPQLHEEPPPTPEELALIRALDVRRLFLA